MALELRRFSVPWSVLDRYLIGEILAPFLFGVGLFSSLGFAVGVLFDLVRRVTEFGLPLSVALKVAAFSSPQFICYAFPMSILLATLMAYSRLAADSELIALRSVGVSVYRIVVPGIVVSLLITALTFIFNDIVVPRANYYAAITLEEALTGETPQFQDSNILYPEYQDVVDEATGQSRNVLSRLFYAERYDGQAMHNLTVVDRSQQGVSQIITSEAAQWNPRENKWDFFNGTIYLLAPDGSFRNILRFDQEQLQLPRTPLDLVERVRDNTEMTIAQAREHLKLLRVSGDLQQMRKITVRLHQKISFPFACLIFGLVGAALGTRSQGGRATSFAISVMTIFLYYTLFTTTGAMGVAGVLPPFPAAWITNVLGLLVGGIILVQVAR